jgi:hypothetical protein
MDKRVMEERIEDLLQQKDYWQLTDAEKDIVIEILGSEEQYQLMRKVNEALVANRTDLSPDPAIRNRLQSLTRTRATQSAFATILTFKVPAYAMVLVAIFAFVVAAMINDGTSEDQRQASNVSASARTRVVDTLYVRDTLYVDRIVVRYKQREAPKESHSYRVVNTEVREEKPEEGVNMKEQEELETLLVSGS